MDRFELAQQLIRKAGAALRQCRPDRNEVARKTGHQDLVTRWDKATEQLLRKTISAAFPRDALVGEEYPRVPGSKDAVVWYLDPIDGTTNFVNEHRNYAISIGCWQGENPLFGMVLDVEEDRLYWARPGEGAWRNDAPIRVSDRETVPELLFTTSCIQYTFFEDHPCRSGMLRLAQDVRAVRSLGSVALEICQVAAGEADVYVTIRSCPWDHNAARIILQEAGGAISSLGSEPLPLDQNSTVLAANSPAMLEKIRQLYVTAQ